MLSRPRSLLRPRTFVLLIALLLVLALACGAWLAYRGLGARDELNAARGSLVAATDAGKRGDLAAAQAPLAALQQQATRAQQLTHDPVWAAAAWLPYVGPDVAAVRGVTQALADVATGVLPPLLQVAPELTPDKLRSGPATINVAALQRSAVPVAQALARLEQVNAAVGATPSAGLVAQIEAGRSEVVTQLAQLTSTLRILDVAARVLPSALGAQGQARWFVALQTPAEARGTGGLLGGYAVVDIRRGAISLDQVAVNGKLPKVGAVDPPELSADYLRRWKAWRPNDLWVNAGVSPDFPTAAAIWSAKWAKTPRPVQGVMSVDPFVLGYLLDVVGPVSVGDQQIDGANAAAFFLKDAYRLYSDNNEREAALSRVMSAVFARLFSGQGDTRRLIEVFARGVREGRVQAAMPESAQQPVLARTRIGGALPTSPAPYLGVFLNDAGGSKLDTYLTRDIDYRSGACSQGRRLTTVRVRLGNDAPTSGLPAYVTSRVDVRRGSYPLGQRRVYLSVYATPGTQLLGAEIDGRPATVESDVEGEHPVFSSYLVIDPSKKRTMTLRLSEPSLPGPTQLAFQPLVAAPVVVQRVASCTVNP